MRPDITLATWMAEKCPYWLYGSIFTQVLGWIVGLPLPAVLVILPAVSCLYWTLVLALLEWVWPPE